MTSIAAADRQLERLFHAGGGTDAFLDEHAVIVVADHSHAPVEKAIELQAAYAELQRAGAVRRPAAATPRSRVCPAQRSAMVYALLPEGRDALVPRIVETAAGDRRRRPRAVAPRAARGARSPTRPASCASPPAATCATSAAGAGRSTARSRCSTRACEDGVLRSHAYPDALGRVWSALTCPTSGDVLLSAAPGYEFADWGGVDHVGGGSHGSLHRVDSLGRAGLLRRRRARTTTAPWSIADVAPMVRAHFGA